MARPQEKWTNLDDEMSRFEAEILKEGEPDGSNRNDDHNQKPNMGHGNLLPPPPPPPSLLVKGPNIPPPPGYQGGPPRQGFSGRMPGPHMQGPPMNNGPHGPFGPPRHPHGPQFNMRGPRPPPNFTPHQLMRPNGPPGGMRPPLPPPHLMMPPSAHIPPPPPPNAHQGGVCAASAPVIHKPQSSSKVVYASQPTRYTNIIKPADSNSVNKTDSFAQKRAFNDKDSKKNKKQKSTNAVEMAQKVKTTVTVTKSNRNTPATGPVSQPATNNTKQTQPFTSNKQKNKKDKKPKKNLRYAGGTVWEDQTLAEWDNDDYRMFAGDLGNDVTEELLTRTFSCYPNFVKARVVRDKFTNKSKGYGFLSFSEPVDYTRAMKEMNGRYVGSRPIKLRKSSWKDRNLDVVQKKLKEKTLLGLK